MCDELPHRFLRHDSVIHLSQQAFERLVADALDSIGEPFHSLMDNLVVVIDDESDDPDLLGLYEGVPLTEREHYGFLDLPDRVTIYRLPICRTSGSEADVIDEVRITVVHEIAHHFGIDDDRLHELGWG